ncbi:MAG TPA: toxin-antitoxin system HicB family antitoxin [Gemmatimonadaceae bacterium]|jgi:predicted HicB family RNase H-like nuclease
MKPYRGYRASVVFDDDAHVLFGTVDAVVDVVTFEATSVEGIEWAFHASVDDYLAMCETRGEAPNRTYSGRILLRLGADLHRAMAEEASGAGVSLNALIVSRLEIPIPTALPEQESAFSGEQIAKRFSALWHDEKACAPFLANGKLSGAEYEAMTSGAAAVRLVREFAAREIAP